MFKIAHLYPKELNLYGDTGNVYYVKYFLNKFGIKSGIYEIGIGDVLDDTYDFIFAGGGPDSLQNKIYQDFLTRKSFLIKHIHRGKPSLFICGSYQLMGKYYLTADKKKIKGLNIFDIVTKSPPDQKHRLVGNSIITLNESVIKPNYNFDTRIIGFQNHNGRTYLNSKVKNIGKSKNLYLGNNDVDYGEGLLFKKTLCSYLHGPLLVKNPQLAYYLLYDYLKNKKKVPMYNFFAEYISHKNILLKNES
ncbi:glutamine amidotransferase [candidate division WWE3 bacterium CG10_big_fil_rev_8_21_14_0_10_32_10]|uniref:Lipid II isoglutaminyl synthase (glutamine-hydrolyzing) subunit GatD n=1 Tax=candidate division WWE3 bacterium CG10_big_fil_rev_8_21_14_0_10_32_10 TaxID=1975090 RepID=A0A2H0RAV6_UNCKA|nr:MAG: glutamine amidotransferase [candidate division WWE3 bacterium CG10_big_fil_rev_8_21_14_0_10_32_10]